MDLVNNNYSLISLDAISLFTNIPLDLAIKSISDRWRFITHRCIPKDEFLKALRLVLESTFFTFDNIYNQKFGTPMDSSLSPIIADLVMENLEQSIGEIWN